MAEEADQEQIQAVEDIDEPDATPGYQPPAKKTISEINELDKDDESLVKYKQQLLAGAAEVLDEGGANVLVRKMIFHVEGREDIVLDLTGDLAKLKEHPITIKEGIEYRIVIEFRVQREIVAGLRYFQTTSRKGIKVDKSSLMVGSYGPKTEPHLYQTPNEEAPSGMISRGHYTVKSKFTDDDKTSILEWDWAFDIKKDWK
ncbi:rho GDP dissociation inhibitor (GDI) isoform X1 [Strongylocentrotus purpuratus]|uniref:Rho GDP-dissociation inhibitor 3 n=1 Tax=Strongylocentrotus purpuratus TaxID=7668 RepID=A0A7M6W5Y7_STRPU|nr:Rho GDP dissociation inhibitor (GDI) [Strongylocentrotus purpuratus]XP_011677920.1 rho GDP dissociation inhibitor (GDI) isoform X1 [Strongylocentrotus purpuratus]|eukprot:NP_001229584.1 Rho GDP dissociation inhibitor (GDI) [Strongylocentrotus purpuratus]